MVLLSTELDGYPIVFLSGLQNPYHVVNKVLDQFQVQGIFCSKRLWLLRCFALKLSPNYHF